MPGVRRQRDELTVTTNNNKRVRVNSIEDRLTDATSPRHWSAQEDELLRAAVEKIGARRWKTIAQTVPKRSHTQCLQRWNKVLRPGLRKGSWTDEEDTMLANVVTAYLLVQKQQRNSSVASSPSSSDAADPNASVPWADIAARVEGRSTKQCRERWCYNLDTNVKKGEWSANEDAVLLSMQEQVGNCWSKISRALVGRTEHSVKTRFRSITRARKREWKRSEDVALTHLQKKFGNNWDSIAANFPTNRTRNALWKRYRENTNMKPSLGSSRSPSNSPTSACATSSLPSRSASPSSSSELNSFALGNRVDTTAAQSSSMSSLLPNVRMMNPGMNLESILRSRGLLNFDGSASSAGPAKVPASSSLLQSMLPGFSKPQTGSIEWDRTTFASLGMLGAGQQRQGASDMVQPTPPNFSLQMMMNNNNNNNNNHNNNNNSSSMNMYHALLEQQKGQQLLNGFKQQQLAQQEQHLRQKLAQLQQLRLPSSISSLLNLSSSWNPQ